MDSTKYKILESLPFWNLIITIILGVVGFIVATGIQDRVEEIEIENRAQTFRPKIELKYIPEISHIVLSRDTNWIRPQHDYKKGEKLQDSVKMVPMVASADFSFTLINNSEDLADLVGFVLFDTTSSIPESIYEFTQRSSKDSVTGNVIQLDYQDTIVINFDKRKISYWDRNTFYLHLIILYYNQFRDFYQSYFIIKGIVEKKAELQFFSDPKVVIYRVEKAFMKNDYIKLESPKKYSYLLDKDEKALILERNKDLFKKYEFKKREKEKFLKNKK